MGTSQAPAHRSRLEGVQRRFERWRRTRKVLSRIPEPLWAAAVKVAGASGISHIGRFVAWPWHPHMIQVKPTIVELDMDKLEEILRRLDAKELDADDYGTIKAVIGAYVHLYHLVGDKDTTIATCQLCGANPFDYLTKLDRHADCAAANPAAWMPWNYRQTCATLPGTAS